MNNPFFSIIIPVFNMEQYLDTCICSVLDQTYNNYEIILVNDGSTDTSSLICNQYASVNNKIHLIHKENGGLSSARNVGLKNAKGKYIIFLDSDDFWIDKNMLSDFVLLLDSTIDFIGFNCSYYYPSKNEYKKWVAYDFRLQQKLLKSEALTALVGSGTFPMSACLKIISKKFLLDNNIYFIEGIFAEDIPWFISLLEKAKCFRFFNMYCYAYRKEVSTSISSSFSKKKYSDLFFIIKSEIAKLDARAFTDKEKKILLSFFSYQYVILLGMVKCLIGRERKYEENELRQYNWLMKYRLNPKVQKVSIIYRILGEKITSWFLYFYIKRYIWR